MAIELEILSLDLAIAKLSEIDQLDELFEKAEFVSLTKTNSELSLVVDAQHLPKHQYANENWKALKIIGPLEFSLVGVLQQVLSPLAENGISIFTISTFDTDYILIKKEHVGRATKLLQEKFVIRNVEK